MVTIDTATGNYNQIFKLSTTTTKKKVKRWVTYNSDTRFVLLIKLEPQ